MKCKCVFRTLGIWILCVGLFCNAIPVQAEDVEAPVSISAEAAIVLDLEHGQVLFEKQADASFSQSFVANIMTTIIAVDSISPGTLITASTNAVAENTEDVQLQAGGIYTLEDLLSASILTLSDNAAIALYEAIDADSEKFISQMATKAASLSMKHTVFSAPYRNGQQTVTTAKDIAAMMEYAYNTTGFHDIFCSNIQFVSEEINEKEFLKNSNDMLWRYSYAVGGLAAAESEDTISAVTYVNRNDMHLLIVLLNSSASNNAYIADTAVLSDYAVTSFEKNTLATTGQVLYDATIAGETISLIAANDVTYLAPYGRNYITDADALLLHNITPPIKAGDYIGSMRYKLEDGTAIQVPMLAQTGIYSKYATLNDIVATLSANQEITTIISIVFLFIVLLAMYHLITYIQKKAKRTK